jgi:cytoskeletal protein RodZ
MEVGSKLQQARLEKGIALREISNATKISLHMLEAIERNDLTQLPGGIFARGYLRAYAAQLGLDPEQIVREFLDQAEGPPAPVPLEPPVEINDIDWAARLRSLRVPAMLALGAALIIYTALVSRSTDAPADEESVATVATAGELENPPSDAPVVVSGTKAGNETGLRLELQPRGECWVSATADGRLVVYRLMGPGERATLDATDEIRLRVGDAGAFSYLINGEPGRQLGRQGEAVTVRITRGNYDSLLTSTTLQVGREDVTDTPTPEAASDTPSSPLQSTGA